jgi:hypothetical protein
VPLRQGWVLRSLHVTLHRTRLPSPVSFRQTARIGSSSALKWLTVPVGGAVAGWVAWKCVGLDPLAASLVTSATLGTVDVCKNIAASLLDRAGQECASC